MVVEEVVAFTPSIRFARRRQIDRPVRHGVRKAAVEQIELAVTVVPPQRKACIAAERRSPDDELRVLMEAAVVPDARRLAVADEPAVGDVAPPARADVVDPSLETAVRVVVHPRV